MNLSPSVSEIDILTGNIDELTGITNCFSMTKTDYIDNNGYNNQVNVIGDIHIDGDLAVNTTTLCVDTTNNRVGINTTQPDTTLQVLGDTYAFATSGNPNVQEITLFLGGDETNQRKTAIIVKPYGGWGKNHLHFCQNFTNDLTNASLSDSKMVLTATGLVGIGSTNPTSALDVVGDINCSGVVDCSNGAIIEVSATPPSTSTGRMYYDTDIFSFRIYDGSSWRTVAM